MRPPSPVSPARTRRASRPASVAPRVGPVDGFRRWLGPQADRATGTGRPPATVPPPNPRGAVAPCRPTDDGGDGQASEGDAIPAHLRMAEIWAALPPPGALTPPVGPPAPPPAAGSPQAHAEVAAMAERLLSSFRVGSVGHHGHEVRMRLRGAFEGVEVRLRHTAGRLSAELHAPPQARERAARLAARLAPALGAQGALPCSLRVCPRDG